MDAFLHAACQAQQQMDQQADVWVLRHDNGRDDAISIHATRDHGLAVLARDVRTRWDNITGNPGVPASPAEFSNEEAVELYFQYRDGIETYDLYPDEVNGVPGSAMPCGPAGEDADT